MRQFRDLSSSTCAFRAKDEIDRGQSQRRQEGLTAPRHPQVLAHSFLDMPINMGLHTFTYTHIHRYINISEKAAYQDTQEIHCPAHMCISRIAGPQKTRKLQGKKWPGHCLGRQIHVGYPQPTSHTSTLSPTVPGSSELHFFHQSSYFILNPSLRFSCQSPLTFGRFCHSSGVIDAPSLRGKGSKVRSL